MALLRTIIDATIIADTVSRFFLLNFSLILGPYSYQNYGLNNYAGYMRPGMTYPYYGYNQGLGLMGSNIGNYGLGTLDSLASYPYGYTSGIYPG
jgi:hypothetical protein